MIAKAIADDLLIPAWQWTNKEPSSILSARGKVFKGNHVHSIVKKKRIRDEWFYKKFPEEWSDISFEVVDKSLINSFLFKIKK